MEHSLAFRALADRRGVCVEAEERSRGALELSSFPSVWLECHADREGSERAPLSGDPAGRSDIYEDRRLLLKRGMTQQALDKPHLGKRAQGSGHVLDLPVA